MDANFRQKARLRPNDARDKALGPGWATFVNYEPYAKHIREQATQDEVSYSLWKLSPIASADPLTQVSHCVGFAALWNANTKRSKGLRATGIGALSCACHQTFLANGMGDLQKGER